MWRKGRTGNLGVSERERNRRPFRARCGNHTLWMILDNQHPWYNLVNLMGM
ncbi:hypothetical protein [Aneurinibacillus migulanus]|uniref:hypothetical protein n=1 Tax=Aneurinibacillus migulanus TaxID=47500 RepID=UPI001F23E261|nr:hypothetical protein [Aneurinibacillus migulanus]